MKQLDRIEQKVDKLLSLRSAVADNDLLTVDEIKTIYGVSRYHLKKLNLTNHNTGGKTARKLFKKSEVEQQIKTI